MQPADRPAEIMDRSGIPRPADPLPEEPKTELGYARRLIYVYGGQLRYVPAWRSWLVWDGRRWTRDGTGQASRWMKVIARQLTTEALTIEDSDKRRAAMNIARKAESNASVKGALALACTESEVVVSPDQLDADPFLLNCRNGTLDLHTLTVRAHDPADLITKLTGASYDPDAKGSEFTRFLERVQPKQEMRDYLARLLGHGLEGRVTEHLLPILHGAGRNGKGTLTSAVIAALGEYADAADPDLLTARTFDAHPTSTADLFGLRLAVLHETDRGRRLAEATVKRLTGGDRIKARRMREDFWHFDPSHTFLMLTNHKPIISGTDVAIWARLRLVPWDVVIPPEERDLKLADKLALELDAVLSWLVGGYKEWREQGLGDPDDVVTATENYRGESDAIGRFLRDCCMDHGQVRSSDLFDAWQKWCIGENEDAGSQTMFSTELTNRGYDKKPTNAGKFWQGVGLAGGDGS